MKSGIKQILGLSLMIGAMATVEGSGRSSRWEGLDETLEEKKKRLAKAEVRNNVAKGLKEFNYGFGNKLWALNEKSADKKARKRGWIE